MGFGAIGKAFRRQENAGMRAVTRQRGAFALACLLTCAVPTATANDLCGATVFANVKLDQDLTCVGDGLIVGADTIRIHLNGHTITGSGSGIGITVTNRSGVVIIGGTIKNFTIGVQLAASTGITIKEMGVTGNRDGIFLIGSSGNTIKENKAWQNSRVGVMLRPGAIRNSTQNLVSENTLSDNTNGVILVETPSGNVFKENIISGSNNAGMALNGGVTANLIKENTFGGNATGILFSIGATGLLPHTNTFVENTITMNGCGSRGPISDNTFKENLFEGNGADSCP
jgi:parallel beta-helix repeat protein